MIVPDSSSRGGERTKLLDFGIAKLLSKSSSRAGTVTNAMMGTPVYMSPEQCQNAASVDDRADVYSLGVLLFQMLAGRPPFLGEGVIDLCHQHLHDAPPVLDTLVSGLPVRLTKLVSGMLQKERSSRPSMRSVNVELHAISAEISTLPTRPRDPALDIPTIYPGIAPPSRPTGESPPSATPRRAAKWLGIGSGVLVLVLGGFLLGGRWRSQRPVPVSSIERRQEPQETTRSIQIRISSEPSSADVVRLSDGEILGRTPWSMERPASTETLLIKLRLRGYLERRLNLDLRADSSRHELLDPQPEVPSAAAGEGSKSEKGTLAKDNKETSSASPRPSPKAAKAGDSSHEDSAPSKKPPAQKHRTTPPKSTHSDSKPGPQRQLEE